MHSLKIWDKMGERMTPLSFRMLTGISSLPLLLRLFRLLISVKISSGVASSNTIELGKFFSKFRFQKFMPKHGLHERLTIIKCELKPNFE